MEHGASRPSQRHSRGYFEMDDSWMLNSDASSKFEWLEIDAGRNMTAGVDTKRTDKVQQAVGPHSVSKKLCQLE